MRKLEEYLRIAEDAVSGVVYPARPSGLYEPIAYGLSHGGKRLRPVLLLASCDAVGGDCMAALRQAVAIEMFHNFTLLHDDVMDNADLRRGVPTVCRKWDDNTAILSGDTMLTMATRMAAEGVSPEKAVGVLRVFSETAIGVYEGQQYDMEFERRTDVGLDEYIEMIRLKTSVLLSGACRIGAMMGDASERVSNALAEYAVNIGLAFQLQDDWLDVYGDPKVFGKSIGGDILNAKKTYLLIKAMELSNEAEKAELAKWLENAACDPSEKIAAVTAIYDRLRVGDMCRNQAEVYAEKSYDALRSASLGKDAEAFFESFGAMLLKRAK